jgi:phosphatidylglycerophosphate synthase
MTKENLLAADYLINRYYFRPVASRLVPIFAKTPVTPNQLTMLAFAAGLACVASFWTKHYLVGAVLIHAQMILDTCDGGLARYRGLVTEFGAKLDAILDTTLWFLIFLGLAFGAGVEFYWLIAVWLTLAIHLLITRFLFPNVARNMPRRRWFNKWFYRRNLRFGFDEVLMLVAISFLAPLGLFSYIFWVAIIGRNLDWIYRLIGTENALRRG